MAAGAGAEAAGAVGAVDAWLREMAWAEAGAGAGTGVGVRTEEAAGDRAGVEEALDTAGPLSWVGSDGPLEGWEGEYGSYLLPS